ncbi:hypothetical protein ACI65C_002091 [Semiaphis heraclei]
MKISKTYFYGNKRIGGRRVIRRKTHTYTHRITNPVVTTDFAVTTVHVIFQFGIIDRKTSQEWAAEQCNPRKPIEDIVQLPKHQRIQEKHD